MGVAEGVVNILKDIHFAKSSKLEKLQFRVQREGVVRILLSTQLIQSRKMVNNE